MNIFKKTAVFFLVICFILTGVFAADDQWWIGKQISAFEYDGLQNVKVKTVDDVLSGYIGQDFTNDLFNEIYNNLYAQEWVEYISAEALEGGPEGRDLIVRFTFLENPMVSSVTVEGNDNISSRTLLDAQNYEKGDFLSANDLEANASLIADHYKSKGYKDVLVVPVSTFDQQANTESIVYEITEGNQYKIRSILFDGVSVFSAKELKKLLTSREKSFFNSGNFVQSDIDADRVALEQHYLENGYINAKVDAPEINDVTTDEDKSKFLEVVFHVTEGDQWFFGDISYSGNNVFSNEQIDEILSASKGGVHDVISLQTMFDNLSSLYYNNGYISAQIIPVPTYNESAHTVDYSISIEEGTQSVIEEIRFEGLTKTKPYVFERELTFKVGDVFSRDAVIRSQQNIYNTSLVKNIRMNLLQGETENGVVVVFEIEEGNQMELQFGATFGGTVDGFPISGFLQWSDKNLAGTGRDLALSTTLSPDTQSVSISLSDDWVGSKRWSNGISLSVERSVKDKALQKHPDSDYYDGRDVDHVTYPWGYDSAESWYGSGQELPDSSKLMSYDYYRIALGYNTGYTFTFDAGSLTVGGGISLGVNRAIYDSHYVPYEELITKYHERWQFSNKFSLSLTWDGRDLKNNTTKGYVLSAGYTYAGGILGGLSNYNRISFSGAAYHSIFHHLDSDEREKHLVLSFSSNVSFMLDQFWKKDGVWDWYDARYGATIYEMLYIDGMNTGRGFDPETDLSFLWHNQLELSYPLVLDVLNAEAFISATGVTTTLRELSSFSNIDWYFAAGAGIKMRIPGFPLGLYIVKNATVLDGEFAWSSGYIPGGLKLVLAISTSIY